MAPIRTATLLALILLLAQSGSAQYWGERVLEKGFEQTDFFFTPSYLNPYGLGRFKTTTPGLIDDPLLNVVLNPARLALDSLRTAYLYTDFRSAREMQDPLPVYRPWYALDARMATEMIYYPQLYVNTRRELEPVFSGAVIGRPLPSVSKEFHLGLTYQMILQDDEYYSIPQDIYRTAVGYDYSGTRAAAAETMPVVDKYTGKDNIHQAGHFVTGFARYAIPNGLEIGAKLSRVLFNRAGSFGSSNLWEHSYSSGTSLWSNFENRDQGYGHWDAAVGVQYPVSDQTKVGIMAGRLWGDATQALRNADSSYYSYASSPYTSYYNRSANNGREWRHDGAMSYYSVEISTRVASSAILSLLYRREQTTVDIGLNSSILDTSYSTYSWFNGTDPVTSYSQSYLRDNRGGSGSREEGADRFMATVQWQIDDNVHLSVGGILDLSTKETRTSEDVIAVNRSAYWSTNDTWDYRYGLDESKQLLWTFDVKRTSFQIPIFVNIKASEVVEVLLGLNRNMSQWKIDDVTLAKIWYRTSMQNGVLTRQENFGERYTQPTEQVSDVRTTFLAGLTISPSERLRLRLLMVPNFRDGYEGSELEELQWWIGVSLSP